MGRGGRSASDPMEAGRGMCRWRRRGLKAEEAREIIGAGGDPKTDMAERKAAVAVVTFGKIADEYTSRAANRLCYSCRARQEVATMPSDISKSEKGGNTAYLNVGVWYNQDTGQIHITLPNSGWFHTTVYDNPESKRGHRNLFAKLARAMKEAGVPYPVVNEQEPE